MTERLTLEECTRLNAKLQGGEPGTLRDVLELISVSAATPELLGFLAQSKLSKTVNKLSKHADNGVASLAAKLVGEWRALLAKKEAKKAEKSTTKAAVPAVEVDGSKAKVPAASADDVLRERSRTSLSKLFKGVSAPRYKGRCGGADADLLAQVSCLIDPLGAAACPGSPHPVAFPKRPASPYPLLQRPIHVAWRPLPVRSARRRCLSRRVGSPHRTDRTSPV